MSVDPIRICDLDPVPVGRVIRVGGTLYRRALFAGRTMPADDFYEGWVRLEAVPGDATQGVHKSLRRDGLVEFLNPIPVTRDTLRGETP